jgi:hypothetical protein
MALVMRQVKKVLALIIRCDNLHLVHLMPSLLMYCPTQPPDPRGRGVFLCPVLSDTSMQ